LRYAGRISAVKGDIGKARFGLDEGEYGALCRRTDAVFHTAADVRHFAADNRAWMTNVFGTAHTAQFALDAGAALNHISTISVSGEYLVRDRRRSAVFTEADFNIGQNWHDNIYVEGKFLAEQEIYDRIRRRSQRQSAPAGQTGGPRQRRRVPEKPRVQRGISYPARHTGRRSAAPRHGGCAH
jgi:thioester reductase-like protein